jgi:hypothetical protein
MKKVFVLILIGFSLAVLEADNKRMPREPAPIVWQMDVPTGFARGSPMKKYFDFSLN